jgi:hypothetical protein
MHRVDTTVLDQAGMSYDAIQSLKGLDVSDAEVPEILKAKQGGFSDAACVELLKVARQRHQPLDFVDAAAGMLQVGMSEPDVLELARLNQLGLDAGELQATRLAGLPDGVILAIARKHAAGQPVLSGVSLAEMMNTGMSRQTLAELVRRGVPDSQAKTIILMKRHRISDAKILRHYPSGT